MINIPQGLGGGGIEYHEDLGKEFKHSVDLFF
jgi:hypothetical protein